MTPPVSTFTCRPQRRLRGVHSILALASLLVLPALSPGFADANSSERDQALKRAAESVEKATTKAAADRTRPIFHLISPANWINDPNGPLYYKGQYHLFYQHNPYADGWENMHWGHWVSSDLAQWEHLPIALWPSKSEGEDHCFSGCATVTPSGRPLIFYTSIGKREPHCWIAEPEDDSLIKWRKTAGNPVLTESSLNVKYYDFRDPYIFREAGKTYMVHGGNLNQAKGGQACVSLFEALDPELKQWQFKSILFKDPTSANIECPNFFRVGKDWVLITSPHRRCDYFIGDFDAHSGTFTPRSKGVVEATDAFYAPNTLQDPSGRWLMWGWIRGFKGGLGWNGCMTLPRVVSVKEGRLIQKPAPEVAKLRSRMTSAPSARVNGLAPLPGIGGRTLEISTRFDLQTARSAGLLVRASADGRRGIPIVFDGEFLTVDKVKMPLPDGLSKTSMDVRIFLDNSVLEVYAADGALCLSRVIAPDDGDAHVIRVSHEGATMFHTVQAWPMRSTWK